MKEISKEEIRRADYVRTAHQLLDDVMHPSEDKRHLCIIVWDREDLEGIAFDVGAMLCNEETAPPFMVDGEVPSEEAVQACTEHLFRWFDMLDTCNDPPSYTHFTEEAEHFYNSLLPEEKEKGPTRNNTIITSYLCNDCGMSFYIDSFDLDYCPNCGSARNLVEETMSEEDYEMLQQLIKSEKEKLKATE